MTTPPDADAAHARLEIYRLVVEMADRVSARRATANGFFATVNTALIAAIGLVRPTSSHADKFGLILASVAGLALAGVWFLMLLRYRDLNRAKFDVIHDLESRLPEQPYTNEWAKLERTSAKKWPSRPRWVRKPQSSLETTPKRSPARTRYSELGRIERAVPFIFGAIYAAAIIRFALL